MQDRFTNCKNCQIICGTHLCNACDGVSNFIIFVEKGMSSGQTPPIENMEKENGS